jgi:Glycosyl hydrolases family 43/Carbohydrate binding module (family 6)
MKKLSTVCLSISVWGCSLSAIAQNPIVRTMFSADPTVRMFHNRLYLFPSHDILATAERGRVGWFCMEDYHVFSSTDLIDWQDHGVVVSQTTVPWTNPAGYSMWAPDCIERKGKYYFYFPAGPKDGRGFNIGVAIAKKPEGPYVPQPKPIDKVGGIDPNVFIDKDGQAYLYWSAGNFYAAKLKDNMVELATDPVILQGFPAKGLKEGPFLFEREGTYYMTYPHVENATERLEYATATSPIGPFKYQGVIMDEKPGCWTNHQSVVQYKGQWYLFYHHNDYSPSFDKARSAQADYLNFNPDGSIQKVIPTLRGVGDTWANLEIQVDRYSKTSDSGVTVAFLEAANPFLGWFAEFSGLGSWLRYDRVRFGSRRPKQVLVRVRAKMGGSLRLRTEREDLSPIAEVPVPVSDRWVVVSAPVSGWKKGIHDLLVESNGGNPVDVDWVRFQ